MRAKRPPLVHLLLLMVVVYAWMIVHAAGHWPVVLSAWTTKPPTIDGVIDPVEWYYADTTEFTTDMGHLNGTLYVMNDATNLYLGVRVQDTTPPHEFVDFWFDNDHDGIGPELEDDTLRCSGGGLIDMHCSSEDPLYYALDVDGLPPGTNDGAGGAGNDGAYSHYELSHPLDSGDIHDFSLSFGDTVGFAIFCLDPGVGMGYWPFWYYQCWGFADIVIASPSPPVGGIRVPVDKFGLLAPYIGLTSTIVVATVATAIYVKRVKRRKEKQ